MMRLKQNWASFLLSATLLLSFASCDDNFSGITAVVDGQFWRSDAGAVAAIGADSALYITAQSRDFLPLSFRLTQFESADTFALDSTNNAFLLGNDLATGYRAIPGRAGRWIVSHYLAPTTDDQGHIAGEFQLRAFNMSGDSISISEGRFDLSIAPLQE
jgi:hypothetical protein